MGGVAFSGKGTLIVDKCNVEDNVGNPSGGVHFQGDGSLIVRDSYIGNNLSEGGVGGVLAEGGSADISTTTFSGNAGGAIRRLGGQMTVTGSTFDENSAQPYYPALAVGGWGGVITLKSSILASSDPAERSGYCFVPSDVQAGLVDGGYKLTDTIDDSCRTTNFGSFTRTDPQFGFKRRIAELGEGSLIVPDAKLSVLGYYGGPTKTHRPLSGSPAIDSGDPAFAPRRTRQTNAEHRV